MPLSRRTTTSTILGMIATMIACLSAACNSDDLLLRDAMPLTDSVVRSVGPLAAQRFVAASNADPEVRGAAVVQVISLPPP